MFIKNRTKYLGAIPISRRPSVISSDWKDTNLTERPDADKFLDFIINLLLLYIYENAGDSVRGGRKTFKNRKNKKSQRKTRHRK